MRANRPSGSGTPARARPGRPRAGASSHPGSRSPPWAAPGADACRPPRRRRAARPRPRARDGSLIAPHRGLAGAAVQQVAVLILRPLRAARPPLRLARERARTAAGRRAGLLAVLRRDADRVVAALVLALVDPSCVAPARVLRGPGCGGEGEK